MLKNYLLLAFKHFRKHRLFSLINVLGLTVGITCCLMIFLFIQHELSFDAFHHNAKYIYRVNRVSPKGNNVLIPYLSPPFGPTLRRDYPDDIVSTVRVDVDNDLVSYNKVSFNEKKIILVDSNFFTFFDFPLLRGDRATVLKDPLSIVMTASAAKRYFGDADPIGKIVDFNKKMELKVTGIAADPPTNSHLDFDMVVPITNWAKEYWMNQWPANSLFVYAQLNPSTDPARLIKKFPAFMDKYLGKYYRENGFHLGLTITPLRDAYFEKGFPFEAGAIRHGSRATVYIFMSIAVLLLVIACINFMNLSTARATERSREVGLRKVVGALRRQLATQFMFESILFATIATVLAVALLQALMPVYSTFLGYQLSPWWTNSSFYLFLLGVIVAVGVLAGSYPALLLSSFSPIESLKGRLRLGRSGAFFRNALVVFQFGISVVLIISVSIVVDQMHFVHNADLGFSKEQAMIVRLDNGQIWSQKERFKSELLTDPSVINVSLMSGEPGGFHDNQGFEAQGRPGDKPNFNTEFADVDYARTLGLKIIAGRDLSSAFSTDTTNAALINRTAATAMGYTPEQAVGKWVRNMNDTFRRTIVGVVEDYHYASLKEPIGALVISTWAGDRRLALIKLKAAGLPDAIDRIQKIYRDNAADYPFEYSFLDKEFDRSYRSEAKQGSLLSIFSIIAIGIACLGLFGLAAYTAIKRTREIGIRKVLGSSVNNIVLLLSQDLLKPVLIGTLIALPVGYWVMHRWLENFAYRISMHWWLFAVSALTGILIALLTVSTQAIKAALASPAKVLRSE